MKKDSQRPVPIPLSQRLLYIRLQLFPVFVFLTTVASIVFLWRDYVSAPLVNGPAEQVSVQTSPMGRVADKEVLTSTITALPPALLGSPRLLSNNAALLVDAGGPVGQATRLSERETSPQPN